jgi:hypothetical protein
MQLNIIARLLEVRFLRISVGNAINDAVSDTSKVTVYKSF